LVIDSQLSVVGYRVLFREIRVIRGNSGNPSTPIALANMFPPGILLPMLRRAGDVPNQMTDTVKVEPALDLSINQVAHKGRFGSFLSGRSAP
jgi:hypothetical protein